jgi:hypothetical protein
MDAAKDLMPIENLHPSLENLANTFYYEGPHHTLLRDLSHVLDKVDKFDSSAMNRKRRLELQGLEKIAGKDLALSFLQLRVCLSNSTAPSDPKLLKAITKFCPKYLSKSTITDTMAALQVNAQKPTLNVINIATPAQSLMPATPPSNVELAAQM